MSDEVVISSNVTLNSESVTQNPSSPPTPPASENSASSGHKKKTRTTHRLPEPISAPLPISSDLSVANLKKYQVEFEATLRKRGSLHPLAHTWIIWYHDDPDDWSLKSYHPIWRFSTIEGFWAFENNRASFADCYLLLMKEGHPPIWEVPENRQGGSWGFRFPKKVADEQWKEFSLFLIGETIANNTSQLIGLSMSPKIYNVTIRIWNKNSEAVRDQVQFREEILRHKHVYKEFRDHKD